MIIVSPAAPTENPRIPARPTTYNGVRMRSRLEARFAASLDQSIAPPAWDYEPRCFANSEGQYLPDFYIVTDPTVFGPFAGDTYVEVKPEALTFGNDTTMALFARMAVIWHSEPDAHLVIVSKDDEDRWRTRWLSPASDGCHYQKWDGNLFHDPASSRMAPIGVPLLDMVSVLRAGGVL